MQVVTPSVDHLTSLHSLVRILNEKFKHQQVIEEDLKAIGSVLWDILQIEDALSSFTWVIESALMSVQDFPWESLYHPQWGFLAQHPQCTLSRRFSPALRLVSPPKGPLKILLFTAQSEKHRLFPEFEQHLLRKSLQPYTGQVQLYAPEDGRFSTFMNLLNFSWHVVLLVGHGFQKSGPQGDIQSFFVFEHEQFDHDIVSDEKLVQLFEKTEVQCVVVAACDSIHLAMHIAQSGLPHVVGMRGPLLDRAGSVFIQHFCLALVQQQSMGVAMQQARHAIQSLLGTHEMWNKKSDPSIGQWSLPVLFSQMPDQPVVDWNFRAQLLPPDWLGCQVSLPSLFIGRRKELRTMGEALCTGQIRCLLVRGKGGCGKTAFVGQLVKTLIEFGYRVLVYQKKVGLSFHEVLSQAFPCSFGKKNFLEQFLREPWIVWLDQFDQSEEDVLAWCASLYHHDSTSALRILVTSRNAMPSLPFFHDYLLDPIDYQDFSRYLEYEGGLYPEGIKWLIYRALEGNFRGVQLLQSFPLHPGKMSKQLNLVRRYLHAYWRE